MAWNPNIPQPNNLLSQSQDDILQNFTELNTVVNPTIGNHLFPVQPADPPVVATTMQVYSKVSAIVPAYQALFLERETGAAGPLPAIVEWTTALAANSGWARLPSGILIKWGSGQTQAPFNPYTFVYPVAVNIPVFTAVFNVSVTTANGSVMQNANVQLRDPVNANVLSFDVTSTERTANVASQSFFSWLAIGV